MAVDDLVAPRAVSRASSSPAGAASAPHRRPLRRRLRRRAGNIFTVVALLIGAAFILLPIFWIVTTAFKPPGDAFVMPPKFIFTPTLSNFSSLLSGQYNQYVDDIGHSLIIMAFSVGIALLLGVPAGYGLARSRFKGSGAITGWLIVAYIVPALVYIVPLYAIYQRLNLSGSYLSVILYYLTFELPFVVFMMRGYFSDLPNDLEDAARVDGCSRFSRLPPDHAAPRDTRALDGNDPRLHPVLGRVLRRSHLHGLVEHDRPGCYRGVHRPDHIGLEHAGGGRSVPRRTRAGAGRLRAAGLPAHRGLRHPRLNPFAALGSPTSFCYSQLLTFGWSLLQVVLRRQRQTTGPNNRGNNKSPNMKGAV